MNKQYFASYLEELSHEIRGFELNMAYVDDVCSSLRDKINSFYIDSAEYCRLKLIKGKDNAIK